MIRVCIGYDPAETVAYHVLCHSILARCSQPVSFIPINKRNIPEFTRGMEDGSTEFSFSRFLTPFLSGYFGRSIFMDCDMLVMTDLAELIEQVDESSHHDVYAVKHDYVPIEGKKFLGNTQHVYPKKNWSSLMVFNNASCRILTPEIVNAASGKYLHQFEWANNVGALSPEWNHLVGEYEPNKRAKIAHYTLGTPCFKGYEDQEFADEWFKEKERMNHAD